MFNVWACSQTVRKCLVQTVGKTNRIKLEQVMKHQVQGLLREQKLERVTEIWIWTDL